uniref:Uncharacterized protein n=1 Tax=Setaria viridis TaxID=4556 RepID=A0A4U6SR38_SETVI|nr:hypothetical protein SEVIR_9G044001v2 [Setaria viridis]
MSKAAEISEDIIEITDADLKYDQKEELARHLEEYRKTCLQSFSRTRSGETVKKAPLLTPRHITIAEDLGKMSDMIQQSIYQAMIDQSTVMTNTVYNTVISSLVSGVAQGYQGFAYAPPIVAPIRASSALPSTSHSTPQPIPMQHGGYNASIPLGYNGAPCYQSQAPSQSAQISSVQSLPSNSVPWGAPAMTTRPDQSISYGNSPVQASFQSAIWPTVPQYQPASLEIGRGADTAETLRGVMPMILYDGAADPLRHQLLAAQPTTQPQNVQHALIHHPAMAPPVQQHVPIPQPVIHQ